MSSKGHKLNFCVLFVEQQCGNIAFAYVIWKKVVVLIVPVCSQSLSLLPKILCGFCNEVGFQGVKTPKS